MQAILSNFVVRTLDDDVVVCRTQNEWKLPCVVHEWDETPHEAIVRLSGVLFGRKVAWHNVVQLDAWTHETTHNAHMEHVYMLRYPMVRPVALFGAFWMSSRYRNGLRAVYPDALNDLVETYLLVAGGRHSSGASINESPH